MITTIFPVAHVQTHQGFAGRHSSGGPGLKGPILSPRSKSSMQRACAAALLRKGITEIQHPGHSQDDLAAIDVMQKLGARCKREEGRLIVESNGVQPLSGQIDCGESGLGIRMFTPIAALSDQALTITGKGSLVSRPMHFFNEIFPQLGVHIQSNEGRVPMQIKGPLQPRDIEVDGSLSSQFLTGLLMAYSAAGAENVEIRVVDLKSKPYIDLTLDLMKSFDMHVPGNDNYERFVFGQVPSVQPHTKLQYAVEGDWSGAAFLIVAAAIAGDLVIQGLQKNSTQADKAILQALDAAGVPFKWNGDDLQISQCVELHPEFGIRNSEFGMQNAQCEIRQFSFNATECPDLFPPLVALAAYAPGISTISGALRLTHKESNRALTLQEEFGKMGIRIELKGDDMLVHGGTGVHSSLVHSRHDHRIAMAEAVAALGAEGPVTIELAEAIGKSYPDFYMDLEKMGVRVQYNKELIDQK